MNQCVNLATFGGGPFATHLADVLLKREPFCSKTQIRFWWLEDPDLLVNQGGWRYVPETAMRSETANFLEKHAKPETKILREPYSEKSALN